MFFVFAFAIITEMPANIYANERAFASVQIPVRQEVNQRKVPDNAILTAVLEPVGNAPMPEDGSNSINLKGNEAGAFGVIRFERPDLYEYRVYRKPANIENYKMTNTRYEVVVAVLSNGETKIISKEEGTDGKAEEILFKDRYRTPFSAPSTGDAGAINSLLVTIFAFVALVCMVRMRKHME